MSTRCSKQNAWHLVSNLMSIRRIMVMTTSSMQQSDNINQACQLMSAGVFQGALYSTTIDDVATLLRWTCRDQSMMLIYIHTCVCTNAPWAQDSCNMLKISNCTCNMHLSGFLQQTCIHVQCSVIAACWADSPFYSGHDLLWYLGISIVAQYASSWENCHTVRTVPWASS